MDGVIIMVWGIHLSRNFCRLYCVCQYVLIPASRLRFMLGKGRMFSSFVDHFVIIIAT